MWIKLNDEGMKIWGDIFPDGKVPVTSMQFQDMKLGPARERAVLVAWKTLPEEKQNAILNKIHERTGGKVTDIQSNILEIGLPIRESLTTGVIAA